MKKNLIKFSILGFLIGLIWGFAIFIALLLAGVVFVLAYTGSGARPLPQALELTFNYSLIAVLFICPIIGTLIGIRKSMKE